MEIPEINMISLQNPSLISRSFSIPSGEVFRVYSFWKWGVLVFTIFAAFGGLIRRMKVILFRFQTTYKPCLNEDKIVELREDDDNSLESSDDDDDEGENEDDDDSRTTTSFDDDFCVRDGDGPLRRRRGQIGNGVRFDWSDFTSRKSVVKLWDGLSSSFNFGAVAFYDFDGDGVVSEWSSVSDRSSDTPAVVLTAEGNGKRGGAIVLRGYDARVQRCFPALYAEWWPQAAVGRISDGDNGVLTVGDVRNVKIPLENGGETWWDSDAVVVEDEFVMVDESN